MKGLLIKDLCLLKGQRNFFLIILLFAVVTLFTSMDPVFIVSYSTIIISMFTMSTLSYDEYDNGYPYLFSLPVTRKSYVMGKYIFALLICGVTWLAAALLSTVYQSIQGFDRSMLSWLFTIIAIYLASIYINAFMIPLQLKFGGEKGKIAVFGVFVIIVVACFAFHQLCQIIGFDWMEFLNQILETNKYLLLGMIGISPIIILPISYKISVMILNKKEF